MACIILPIKKRSTIKTNPKSPSVASFLLFLSFSSVGTLVTSVIPVCSNDSAAVEVIARSYDNIRNEDRRHASLFVRIDYICIGHDGQQVRDN